MIMSKFMCNCEESGQNLQITMPISLVSAPHASLFYPNRNSCGPLGRRRQSTGFCARDRDPLGRQGQNIADWRIYYRAVRPIPISTCQFSPPEWKINTLLKLTKYKYLHTEPLNRRIFSTPHMFRPDSTKKRSRS